MDKQGYCKSCHEINSWATKEICDELADSGPIDFSGFDGCYVPYDSTYKFKPTVVAGFITT